MSRAIAASLVIAAGIAFSACGGTSSSSDAAQQASNATGGVALGSPATTVDATDNLVFDSASVSVHVNDIVQWKNTGTMPHNITFDTAAAADDSAFNVGNTWEVKFTKSGTYSYQCTIHPGMKGTVTVTS